MAVEKKESKRNSTTSSFMDRERERGRRDMKAGCCEFGTT